MSEKQPTFDSTFEKILFPAILGVVLTTIGVWAGAIVSTLLWTRRWLGVGLPQAVGVVIDPAHWTGSMREAWPAHAVLAPAGAYWTFVSLSLGGIGYLAYLLKKKRSKDPKVVDRVRLGASTKSGFAEVGDLTTIAVSGPTYARFILGLAHDPSGQDKPPVKRAKDKLVSPSTQLVATEHRRLAPAKPPRGESEHPRQGDIGSVAVIGPSRSGKTVNVVAGIFDWMGPAVLSSVKGDLLEATLKHRQSIGEVRVFDPMGIITEVHNLTAGWSPLHGINSLEDAQQQSQALQDAAPTGGAENSQFFVNLAGQLLAPMIWVAASSDKTMKDLVRWVKVQDSAQKPAGGNQSAPHEIRRALSQIQHTEDPSLLDEVKRATEALTSVWENDERTRGNIYTTASMMLRAWESPGVMAADADSTQIDLEWLLDTSEGYNTLYLCAPLEDQDRLGVVFGGLLGTLTNDLYKRGAGAKPLSPPLLLVMDEAANTPNQKLPGIVSTCAGLGMLLVTVWQSMSQIQHAYGQRAGDVVTNHTTKLFYAGVSDEDTLSYVSTLGGAEEVFTETQRTDDDKQQGKTVMMSELIPKDLLRRAPQGTALMFHGTLPPIELRSRQWWKDKRLMRLAGGEGPNWTPGEEPGNPGNDDHDSDSGSGDGSGAASNGKTGQLKRLLLGDDAEFERISATGPEGGGAAAGPTKGDAAAVGDSPVVAEDPADDIWDRPMPEEPDPFDSPAADDGPVGGPDPYERDEHPDVRRFVEMQRHVDDSGGEQLRGGDETAARRAAHERLVQARAARAERERRGPRDSEEPRHAGPRLRPPRPPDDSDDDEHGRSRGDETLPPRSRLDGDATPDGGDRRRPRPHPADMFDAPDDHRTLDSSRPGATAQNPTAGADNSGDATARDLSGDPGEEAFAAQHERWRAEIQRRRNAESRSEASDRAAAIRDRSENAGGGAADRAEPEPDMAPEPAPDGAPHIPAGAGEMAPEPPSVVPPFNTPEAPQAAPSLTPRVVAGPTRVKRSTDGEEDDEDDDEGGGGPAFRDGGDTHAVRMRPTPEPEPATVSPPTVAPHDAAERRRRMSERFPLDALE